MNEVATTKLSSKGQVVIPDAIRRRLSLEAGAEFVVLGEDDTIVLKRIRKPALRDFDAIVRRARQAARRAGLHRSDVAAAIEAMRSTVCRDPDDDKFLACALAAQAKYIVSGDRDLLAISGYRGVTVARPHDFIERLRRG